MDKNKIYKDTSKTIFTLGLIYVCLTILATISLINIETNIIGALGVNYIISILFIIVYMMYKKTNKYALTIHYTLGIILLLNFIVHMAISGFNILNVIYPILMLALAIFTHKKLAGIAQ